MSLSTPTAGVHALQLDNEGLPAISSRAEVPDPEGRKRRRITPTNFVSTPPASIAQPHVQARKAVESGAPDAASAAQPGTWDYLAKWETEDSNIVDDIEEEEADYYSEASGGHSEGLEDNDHEADEDAGMPPEGAATKTSKLGADRVVAIINKCIEKYADAWRPGKGETKYKSETDKTEIPVVYDADELWDQAHAAGKREELAEKYELEAEYYRQRLDKLCDEIAKDPGDTETAIKMRCRNLEITVELLERAIWLEGIYKLLPDASSDDGAQGSDVEEPQVIDLGSPSASEGSVDGSMPIEEIPTTPLQIKHPSEPGRMFESRPLSSDPVLLDTIETPGPVVVALNPSPARSRTPLGDAPEHASIASVSRWTWKQLEETQDRKRAVSRAIYEMSSTDREAMRQRLDKVGRSNMIREIPACVEVLSRGDKRMPGVLPQDLPKILKFTRLFLCWWLCGNYLQKEPSQTDLEELADSLRERSPDPSTFCDYVDTILSTTFSLEALNKPTQPSQAEIIEISDDDEAPAPVVNQHRPHISKPGSAHNSNPIVLD